MKTRATCMTCGVVYHDDYSLLHWLMLWHATMGHRIWNRVGPQPQLQERRLSDEERQQIWAFAAGYQSATTLLEKSIHHDIDRMFQSQRHWNDDIYKKEDIREQCGAAWEAMRRGDVDRSTATPPMGAEVLRDDSKLLAVFSADEITAINLGRIDQVVLNRWYAGRDQPAKTGVTGIDEAVESVIHQINILPAGQPQGAPRWPSVRYGDVTWEVNGNAIAMGECPEPNGGTP